MQITIEDENELVEREVFPKTINERILRHLMTTNLPWKALCFLQCILFTRTNGYPASRVASIFPRYVGKEEATLPTSSSSFDLPIIQLFGWVRQVSYWINQFICARTHTLEFCWLFLRPRSITKQIAAASISFMQELWGTFSFTKIGKCTQIRDGFCFGFNHVLSRFYLRERIRNPVSHVTRSFWKDKQMGFE